MLCTLSPSWCLHTYDGRTDVAERQWVLCTLSPRQRRFSGRVACIISYAQAQPNPNADYVN